MRPKRAASPAADAASETERTVRFAATATHVRNAGDADEFDGTSARPQCWGSDYIDVSKSGFEITDDTVQRDTA